MRYPSEILPEQAPKLLDQVRGKIRFKHYVICAEHGNKVWIKRFILHFGKKHPHYNFQSISTLRYPSLLPSACFRV